MSEAAALLWPAFLAALCLVAIHAYFGLQVLTRGVIFVDLALAQVAALGTTVAFMLGHPAQGIAAYGYSLLFTLAAAMLLASTRGWARNVPQEALIGVVYVVAAAAAILLIDRAPQGAEHLKQLLTGNILTTSVNDIGFVAILYLVVGIVHWLLRDALATRAPWLSEFAFFAAFGAVVTSSVAIAGVLLVFSILVVPALIGMVFFDTEPRRLLAAIAVGTAACTLGLVASFVLDLPTGATMVCALGAVLAVAGAAKPFICGDAAQASRRAARGARALASIGIGLSGGLLLVAPRADQPLLDAVEQAVPELRRLYMTAGEREVLGSAEAEYDRFRLEAARLSTIELASRAHAAVPNDVDAQRISSMLKSYGEMSKGEAFVRREVRARARDRNRFILGGAALLVSLLLLPGVVARVHRHIAKAKSRRF